MICEKLHIKSIPPLTREWKPLESVAWTSKSGNTCSRTQLPLRLAWAITVHKSQGLTIPKVIIDLSVREFSSRLTFVAVSWVRALEDIIFRLFTFERLQHTVKLLCTDAVVLGKLYQYIELSVHIYHVVNPSDQSHDKANLATADQAWYFLFFLFFW